MGKSVPWTTSQTRELANMYGTIPHYEIAEIMRRTPLAIRKMAHKMGLKSVKTIGKNQPRKS